MDEKQAIAEIKDKIIPLIQCPALEIAVAALEKQIPKRVEQQKWKIARCPCCDTELGEWTYDGFHKDYDYLKICDCGQKLDWSEPLRCEICDKELSDDEIEWLTRHYPVCKNCYNEMTPEEVDSIIENYG